jgi:hypothetical protein
MLVGPPCIIEVNVWEIERAFQQQARRGRRLALPAEGDVMAIQHLSTNLPPARDIAQMFEIRDETQVSDFLNRHPFLEVLLREAHGQITKLFPAAPQALQLVVDRENVDDAQLALFIGVTGNPKAVLAQLRRLDDEWWLDAMSRAQDKFHINVEFR